MARQGLDNIGWTFTNQCNMNCQHCYNNSKEARNNELNLEEKLEIVDNIALGNRIKAVNFGGGECVIHPDFEEVAKRLHKNGIAVNLNTNGLEVDKLIKVVPYLNKISISMDFIDSQIEDSFRQSKGCNRNVEKLLDALKDVHVQKELVTCINSQSCVDGNLDMILDLALRYDVDIWRLRPMRTIGRGKVNEKWKLTPELLLESHDYIYNLLDREIKGRGAEEDASALFNESKRYYGGGGCDCGTHVLRIHSTGEISPCVYIQNKDMPNIKDKNFDTIWETEIFRNIRNRDLPTDCKDCKSLNSCGGGCPGATFSRLGHFNEKDELCYKHLVDDKEDIYLSSLYVPIWKLSSKSYNKVFNGVTGVWDK